MANPLIDQLRAQIKYGSMHIRLIFVNAIIFVGIGIAMNIGYLNKNGEETTLVLSKIFALETTFNGLAHKPWGLITSIFSHFQFLHFLMNMFFLYFAGNMFLQFFSGRRLLHVYIIGGIVGGLFEIIAHTIFPALQGGVVIVGASGSIMAIFIALAVHRPNIQVQLFGIVPVRLILIAGLYVLYDLLSLGAKDGTAHFAHIGGAFVGFLSVTNLNSSYNIINMSETFTQRWKNFWANLFKPRTRLKVEKGGRPVKSDEQYNIEKKAKQEKTNKILDKISKSGYESLSKAEKEFLFSQSRND